MPFSVGDRVAYFGDGKEYHGTLGTVLGVKELGRVTIVLFDEKIPFLHNPCGLSSSKFKLVYNDSLDNWE